MMNFKGFVVGVYSFFSLLVVIVFMYLFKRKIPLIRRLWASSMVKLIGVEIEEIGSLDPSADLIILNHNSMFDITLLDYIHPKDIAWVTNQKLALTPVFGWIFKLPSLILIDPRKISSMQVLIDESKKALIDKRPIGVFPEGTRGDENTIIDFQKGAKVLAEKLDLKIQAIVLIGTRDRLDTKKFTASSGKAKVIYLDTVETKEKNWFKGMENSMKHIYKENVN